MKAEGKTGSTVSIVIRFIWDEEHEYRNGRIYYSMEINEMETGYGKNGSDRSTGF
jgi:hypothetical protein